MLWELLVIRLYMAMISMSVAYCNVKYNILLSQFIRGFGSILRVNNRLLFTWTPRTDCNGVVCVLLGDKNRLLNIKFLSVTFKKLRIYLHAKSIISWKSTDVSEEHITSIFRHLSTCFNVGLSRGLFFDPKIGSVIFLWKSVYFPYSTLRYILEDSAFIVNRCDNLRSCILGYNY
jgi:hypothetical protein